MGKIKILHIITRLDRGGSSESTLLTVIGLTGSFFNLTLLYGLTHDSPRDLIDIAKKKGIRFIYLSSLVRGISPINDLKAFFSLFSLIKREKFDIIHTNTSKAGMLGRVAAKWASREGYRPSIVHTPHGHVFYGYYGTVLSKLFLALEGWAANFTDRIITLTQKGIDEHLQFGVGKDRSKFTAIPDGVDLNRFTNLKIDPTRKKKELGLPPEGVKLIGSAGRLEPVKGYKYFVEASFRVKKSIPDCLFLLIGDGSLYNKLQHQIESSGLQQNFRILGWRNDINEIISILDIFVLSSLNEGMGRVLVEAMVMGKPVVATKVGGIPSVVIDGETGMLVPSKNPRALAEAIISLLNNPERMKNMSIAGKERAKLFSVEVMIEKTEELYEELLRERR